MNKFRDFIQQRAHELGLSNNELAKRSGKSNSWISKFLNGENKDVKLETFVDLANALQIDPVKLMAIYIGKDPSALDKSKSQEDILTNLFTFDEKVKLLQDSLSGEDFNSLVIQVLKEKERKGELIE